MMNSKTQKYKCNQKSCKIENLQSQKLNKRVKKHTTNKTQRENTKTTASKGCKFILQKRDAPDH